MVMTCPVTVMVWSGHGMVCLSGGKMKESRDGSSPGPAPTPRDFSCQFEEWKERKRGKAHKTGKRHEPRQV